MNKIVVLFFGLYFEHVETAQFCSQHEVPKSILISVGRTGWITKTHGAVLDTTLRREGVYFRYA
jgi:hypothetical protein